MLDNIPEILCHAVLPLEEIIGEYLEYIKAKQSKNKEDEEDEFIIPSVGMDEVERSKRAEIVNKIRGLREQRIQESRKRRSVVLDSDPIYSVIEKYRKPDRMHRRSSDECPTPLAKENIHSKLFHEYAAL